MRDPGLQQDRTVLAWRRTTLTLAANAAIIFRQGWLHGHELIMAIAAILLVGCLFGICLGIHRQRHFASSAVPLAGQPIAIASCASLTLLASLAALWSILMS